jgi:hypothetical protein
VFDKPIVEGAMDFIFQGAERVGDPLDGVRERMLEIVHRIDAPDCARPIVGLPSDAVHHGIAHQEVGMGHIDLGP